ncbi:rfaE bifunctional protein, domain II [Mariniphaga anaerophila]|uniref:RfaE bifunctional protein, domain II n=1 Tax=Mariniphaga anaerophila TaxID=1484053 RepID=A0A1M5CQB5_9BACT|nr:adenylyltransferase/cytidyltransferase family protein [Mariniphaga anaerophila]SHF56602.1 rfaE bifunctional protein, domain II [Mariniphaga anaerophila]
MKFDIQTKIFTDFESFEPTLKKWRAQGDSVVFTNGCFDIIHHGHVDSLLKSSALGTHLIVGLNSDESVTLLKGRGRPVLNVDARASLLAAFVFVDAVIIFPEETPARLIKQIVPDVLVKGKEYELHEIAGHETVLQNNGKVERLDLVSGISTSELIARIKNLD